MLLGYMTCMLLIELLFIAVQARTIQMIYVDNRNYPGGHNFEGIPSGYIFEYSWTVAILSGHSERSSQRHILRHTLPPDISFGPLGGQPISNTEMIKQLF